MGLEYPLIRVDRNEFRLLRIHPPKPPKSNTSSRSLQSTPIECDLFVASRDDPPDYQALSYTWGDPNRVVAIQVNNSSCKVTRNLRTALEHIRQEHKDVIIWVDAVCIDQNDPEEKSDQVQHMTEIYASAKSTIVWLGPAGDGSDEFIEKCNEIGGDLAMPKNVDGAVIPSYTDLLFELSLLPTVTVESQERYLYLTNKLDERMAKFIDEALHDVPGTIAFIKASDKLMSRDYWGRVWVHQEFIVSKEIILHCGHSKVEISKHRATLLYRTKVSIKLAVMLSKKSRDMLENAAPDIKAKMVSWIMDDWPESNDDPDLADYRAVRKQFYDNAECQIPQVTIFGMRRRYQELRKGEGTNSFTLIRILGSVFVDGTAEAAHARDRIYGMLGMADDKEELGLVPDYDGAISDIKIYTDAARAIISAGHIDLLSLAQQQPYLKKYQQGEAIFPSWVPDWSRPITRPSGQLPWNTFFDTSSTLPFSPSPKSTKNLPEQIALQGWRIDTIDTLSPAWIDPDRKTTENEQNIDKFLADIRNLCLISNTKFSSTNYDIYSKSSDRESAHYLIPVADQERNDMGFVRRAGEDSREGYDIFVEKKALGLLQTQGSEASNVASMKAANYVESMRYQRFRHPFLSGKGYVGLAPEFAQEGDVLVVFRGGKFPYCLREDGQGVGAYRFVGDAYVHGIMYGEFVEREREREMEMFVLK